MRRAFSISCFFLYRCYFFTAATFFTVATFFFTVATWGGEGVAAALLEVFSDSSLRLILV